MDSNKVFEIIVTHTREIIPGLDDHAFAKSDRLVELGANSIDRSEIAMLSLETLGVKMPLHELAGYATIGELARTIANYR